MTDYNFKHRASKQNGTHNSTSQGGNIDIETDDNNIEDSVSQ